MKIRYIALLLLTLLLTQVTVAQDNDPEARRTFEKAYNMVFGPQGCQLKYDVNLVGVYRTRGSIWYKGKKSKFEDSKVVQWNDGVTAYGVFKKKKVVEIYDVKSGKHDKYGSKFKFTLDDFNYTMERTKAGIVITLKQKSGAKGTVKQAKALLEPGTLAPQRVKVKVALFWANIDITEFKSGGISDDIFVFPRSQYTADYKFVDKR